jgi:catechol 2,3-dioxygenase-like lactoylglutathione lyase family enzyme
VSGRPQFDHLVYATPDVAATTDEMESRLGIRPVSGGRHAAWGTHNTLLSLGEGAYLEIIGPDPDAQATAGPRPFGLDRLTVPRLATWVARTTSLEAIVRRARAAGIELGGPLPRSRQRPDGTMLRWTMTDSLAPREGGVIPFFIDWDESPHPSLGAPDGGRLVRLEARHPEPARVAALIEELGLDLEVGPGAAPELIATLEAAAGTVVLR